MDWFTEEEWRKEHPFVTALYDKMRRGSWEWNILYLPLEEKVVTLTRGVFGNSDGFYIGYEKKQKCMICCRGHTIGRFVIGD